MILTQDHEMRRILSICDNIATSRASILIVGESGTGKELLARYLHGKSPRASKRMVAINCAAVPDMLLESELFGHEKGSFTSAHAQKLGKFEIANQSTLLLDEMGELPLHLQPKLLRAIQEGEIERVGGVHPLKVNVRLIATTHRDLSRMVQEGTFREDLFYRLNVITVRVPPLRERPGDIELLARHFSEVHAHQNGRIVKPFSPEALQALNAASWPGNVRELENVIERAVLLCQKERIEVPDLELPQERGTDTYNSLHVHAGMKIADIEKSLIFKTLEFTNQNRTHAARLLGISIRTLRNKLHEYNKTPQEVRLESAI